MRQSIKALGRNLGLLVCNTYAAGLLQIAPIEHGQATLAASGSTDGKQNHLRKYKLRPIGLQAG